MAARALSRFAIDYSNQKELVDAGAISPLVALLDPQLTAAVQEQAAGALCRLAVHDDNRDKIAAAGAIPPLVALLDSATTADVQEQQRMYRSRRQGLWGTFHATMPTG